MTNVPLISITNYNHAHKLVWHDASTDTGLQVGYEQTVHRPASWTCPIHALCNIADAQWRHVSSDCGSTRLSCRQVCSWEKVHDPCATSVAPAALRLHRQVCSPLSARLRCGHAVMLCLMAVCCCCFVWLRAAAMLYGCVLLL